MQKTQATLCFDTPGNRFWCDVTVVDDRRITFDRMLSNIPPEFVLEPCDDDPRMTSVRAINSEAADVRGQILPTFCVAVEDARRLLDERPLAVTCWFVHPEGTTFFEHFEKWKAANPSLFPTQ